MPQASFESAVDCNTGEHTITVNVQSIGDANGVDIVILGQNPSFSDVGPGTYALGPFASLAGIAVAVVHGEDGDCTVGNMVWQEQDCPTQVTCGEAPVEESYCYVALEDRSWLYEADGGSALRLQFLRGSIESSNFDQLTIYDGPDANAPVLFTHSTQNTDHNLGPVGSALNNGWTMYHAVDVVGGSGMLYMKLTSDFSVQCSSSSNFDPWEWVVSCLDCELPAGSATVVPGECSSAEFDVEIEITSTGDAATVNAVYTVNGGSPLVIEGLGSGSSNIGTFPFGSNVSIILENATSPVCHVPLGVFSYTGDCPTQVICGAVPLVETHCYQNNEAQTWSYQSVGTGTLNLRFLRGTIESANWDVLRIYDGADATGDLLYSNVNTNSTNLGPLGSAVNSAGFPYNEVNVFSSTGFLHMVLTTDGSVSCVSSNQGYDAWEWQVVCGTVSLTGRSFIDEDLDCNWSASEVVVPQTIIEVLPGPFYATTSTTGEYFMLLNDGAYTISQINPYVTDHCAPAPQPFTIAGGGSQVTIDFPDTAATALDLAVSMSSGAARVGFSYQQAVAVQNLSARQSGAITLTLNIPTEIEYTSAEPAPNTVQGTTLVWQLPALGPFQQQSVQVHYQVPVDISLIGTQLATVATVTIDPQEEETGNNSTVHTRTITAAYDPNDKIATTSSGASGSSFYIDLDNWIDYNIRFQNTGNDTAFTVVITDTLPSALNPTTIQMGAASHPFTWELKGPGILEFTFNNILLPDSFVNEPASHGFVGFRIRPHMPVLLGEEISNTANIFFDFNPPVITEPSVLLAEFSTSIRNIQAPVLSIHPNPATESATITTSQDRILRWSLFGSDGRLVSTGRADSDIHLIELAGLAPGSYIVQAECSSGATLRTILIKQ
ncbi:MAG: hypothetical protein KF905_14980 [Flavobacteriales bacterium]|nr:hypothetical protein [Flavobacteriales bacterium]